MGKEREVLNVWFHRVKTLPSREPKFASSLCSMVCLWLVLIPAFILALNGAEFELQRLIIPSLCALGLAALLFVKWQRLAFRIKEQGRGAKNYSPEALERILGKLSAFASSFQWTGTMLFVLAVGGRSLFSEYVSTSNYSLLVEGSCLLALLLTFILSRIHVYSKKRLEEVKDLSEEEKRLFKHEYLGKFLFPHIVWTCNYVFSHLLMS